MSRSFFYFVSLHRICRGELHSLKKTQKKCKCKGEKFFAPTHKDIKF